jgi:AcrR family transcriptional regulator
VELLSSRTMPRHLFDRPQVVATARRIVDTDGLEALTVRSLASALGTGPASVYRHVENRRELLQLLADDAATELPLPDESLPPRDRLLDSWLALYDAFAARPWLIDLIASGEVISAHASPVAEKNLQALADLGLRGPDLHAAYSSLNALLLGTLSSRHPYGHGASEATVDPRGAFQWALQKLI